MKEVVIHFTPDELQVVVSALQTTCCDWQLLAGYRPESVAAMRSALAKLEAVNDEVES